jgi:hypothetical protein
MALKLETLDARLRARIEKQLAAEDAKRTGGAAHLRPVPPAQPEHDHQREIIGTHPPQAGRPRRVVVSLLALRRRPLDPDNNAASFKALQDAIAETLGLDDGDPRFIWQYQQMHSFGREGVIVRIEVI